ncbi:MAG: hypothetical protein R2788_25765 [Saprospiraceae bacterium]
MALSSIVGRSIELFVGLILYTNLFLKEEYGIVTQLYATCNIMAGDFHLSDGYGLFLSSGLKRKDGKKFILPHSGL